MMRSPIRLFGLALCILFYSHGFSSHKTRLEKAYEERAQLITQLAKLETQEGQLARSLRHTKHAIIKNTWAQTVLKKKQKKIWAQLDATIKTINNMLQISYLWLQQPRVKWLLSDESHETLNELDRYQQSIESTRETEMKRLRHLEKTLIKNQEALEDKADQLKTLLTQQKKAFATLKKTEASRHKVIQHLDTIIREEKLKAQPNTTPTLTEDKDLNPSDSFAPNSLPWPTVGILNTRYGDTYHHTTLKQHGIVIRARMGRAVRAVAGGEVVFARWLPGYGHLMIINHQNGYFSLYGRNRYLEKNVGDQVHAREEIATIGHSGGYAHPGLYFELRYLAHPVNPLAWLTPTPHHSVRKHHGSSRTTHRPAKPLTEH